MSSTSNIFFSSSRLETSFLFLSFPSTFIINHFFFQQYIFSLKYIHSHGLKFNLLHINICITVVKNKNMYICLLFDKDFTQKDLEIKYTAILMNEERWKYLCMDNKIHSCNQVCWLKTMVTIFCILGLVSLFNGI